MMAARTAAAGEMDAPSASNGALAALSLAMLLSSLGTSIANVALPTLVIAFRVSFHDVQWVVLAYLLSLTTLLVGVGRLGDMAGRRKLLLGGLLLFTLASICCGLSPGFGFLIAARAAQGFGAAIMMTLAMALAAGSVRPEKTGSAMGLLGAMSAAGTAAGPSLGGALVSAFGWEAVFLVNAPLGLLAFVVALRTLPADGVRPERTGFDVAGMLLLALSLIAYALAMTAGRGDFGAVNAALLVTAAAGAAAFIRVEAGTPRPLVRPAMFRDPALRAGLAMSAIVTTVLMATLVVGPFYLSGGLGLGAAAVGLVMSAGPLVVAVTSAPFGRLVDRLGARRLTIAGLLAITCGSIALAAMPLAAGVAGYLCAVVAVTLGYALFQAANNTAVMKNVDPAERGAVSGLLNLSRNLGLITGTAVLGAVFAAAAGSRNIAMARPDDVAAGMQVTFAAAAALVVVALIIATGGPRHAVVEARRS